MQKDKKYSEMFEEIDREFFKDDSASVSNRTSSMQAGSKKDFSFAVNHTAEMQKVLRTRKREMKQEEK